MEIGATSMDFRGAYSHTYQRIGSMSYHHLITRKPAQSNDHLFLALDAWVEQFEGEIPFQEIIEVMRDYVEIADDYGLSK
jgi:hypothetical protein